VNSLIVKLSHVIESLNSGTTGAGCNQLSSFINEVQSYRSGGLITAAQGDPLVLEAQAIEAVIPC
jgi:hypothetical protein